MMDRNKETILLKKFLNSWDLNQLNEKSKSKDKDSKKGIYVYGSPGSGKTYLVESVLKDLNYDIIRYDSSDIRNTAIIEDMTENHMTNKNIIDIFNNKNRKKAIVMDEIDGMASGDKGGINALIKLIRPKKTKKQKLDKSSLNPIICIGNTRFDKKIKELMKVCNVIQIFSPSKESLKNYLKQNTSLSEDIISYLSEFINGDLRKLNQCMEIYKIKKDDFSLEYFQKTHQDMLYNNETKIVVSKLFKNSYKLNQHDSLINETDRTSIGLLWHENLIETFKKVDKNISIPFYINQLENICLSDYIDRITFQNQIWQFNEMSSLIKTFKNNYNFHKSGFEKTNPSEIRFTKVLTKYSTEYNNNTFIIKLCQLLGIDKLDLYYLFLNLKESNDESEILEKLEKYDITRLDINRLYKFIDKYLNTYANSIKETLIEEDIEEFNDTM